MVNELGPLLAAIMAVESGNGVMVGDKGKSIGPYQIQKVYWQDATKGRQGSYTQCYNKKYSEQVVKAYWKRYAPTAYRNVTRGKGTLKDKEILARIHNGGPNGYKKQATVKYWHKVQRKGVR